MGAVPSVPTNEIQRIAQEVMTTFVPKYVKAYGLALVADIKRARNAPGPIHYLHNEPIPSEPIKMGYLTKQGYTRKNWKNRFFVAYNQKDNYEIKYYTDEAAYKAKPDSPKGTMYLCWYHVNRGTEEGETWSITIKPWWSSDRRRTWYIKAGDEADAKAWTDVFQIASNKARAPLNPDPIMRTAFDKAYLATRWALGEYGWYYYCSTESQQLAFMISNRCEESCMRDTYAAIPARMESVVRPQVQALLDSTVGAVVGTAWTNVSKTISDASPTIRGKIEAQIAPVIDKEIQIKGQLSSAMSAALTPAVNVAAEKAVPPVAKLLLNSLQAADKIAITVFVTEMKKLIAAGGGAGSGAGATPDGFKAGLADFTRNTYWYWGNLHDAIEPIRNFGNGKSTVVIAGKSVEIPAEKLLELIDGIDLWDLRRDYEELVRSTARKAAFTFGALVEANPGVDKTALLAKVTALYIHDSKVGAYKQIHDTFTGVLLKPIHKHITPLISASVEPLKALIPEAIADFLDIDGSIKDIIEDAIGAVVDSTVIPEVKTNLAGLDGILETTGAAHAIPDWSATVTSGLVPVALMETIAKKPETKA